MKTEEWLEWIATEIDRVSEDIVRGLTADMYRDPFWEMRYGPGGHKHTRQDTLYHLARLKSAVIMQSPHSLSLYYRWVQGLLVYRGMCTLHLQETINSLGYQLAHHLPAPVWEQVQPIHQGSYAGLRYELPSAQALADQAALISQHAAARQQRPARDYRYLLSYLADAQAYSLDNTLAGYLHWLAEAHYGLGETPQALAQGLRLLIEELRASLGEEEAAPFVARLHQAAPPPPPEARHE